MCAQKPASIAAGIMAGTMKRSAALLMALIVAGSAWAQRPNTLNMSCAEARGLVAAHGAIVLGTGTHTFDRFVASPGYCLHGEYAYNASAPTRDRAMCALGYRCDPTPPLFDHGLFGRHHFF